VRPQLAANIGATARAMANCGLIDLRLVAPRDGWPNDAALPMASGATWILDQARVFPTLRAAIADLDHTWATSARPRDIVKRIATARGAAAAMRCAVAGGARVGVVFGPERTGLDTDEVVACTELLEIPLDPAFRSLNLAQAVLLVAYEWFQAADETPAQRLKEFGRGRASMAQVHDFLDHFEAQLVDAGFLRNEQLRPTMVQHLTTFVLRAEPTDQDIRTLHGVLTALSGRRRHQLGPRSEEESS
jgi:TrmH family RNA methyltransferase